MTSAIDMMKRLHDHMVVSNLNAWNWWAIYISADALASADMPKIRQNPALIQPDASFGESYMFKRGYALGNWSKFVRPGFQRIAATDKPTGGVLIEAYRDATHIAVIAVNTGSKPVTQKFILDGTTFGTLTPWVTSPDDNLAAKDAFTAYDTFTYDLPASSVVTFVNWDANTETPNQGTLPGDVDGGTDIRIPTGLDCPNALVPNNGVNGGVTDFSDWKGGSGRWGELLGLWGNIYSYKGPDGSTMSAAVENQALHVTGAVTANDYGGAGLSFQVCTTVASFTHVQFTLSGSSPGCDLELQIKTFDQQPKQQTPPGGCDQNFEQLLQLPGQEAGRGPHGAADGDHDAARGVHEMVGDQCRPGGRSPVAVHRHERRPGRRCCLPDRREHHRDQVPPRGRRRRRTTVRRGRRRDLRRG